MHKPLLTLRSVSGVKRQREVLGEEYEEADGFVIM